MATEQDTAITTQPISRRKEIESFVRDLDPLEVVGNKSSGRGPHVEPECMQDGVTSYNLLLLLFC